MWCWGQVALDLRTVVIFSLGRSHHTLELTNSPPHSHVRYLGISIPAVVLPFLYQMEPSLPCPDVLASSSPQLYLCFSFSSDNLLLIRTALHIEKTPLLFPTWTSLYSPQIVSGADMSEICWVRGYPQSLISLIVHEPGTGIVAEDPAPHGASRRMNRNPGTRLRAILLRWIGIHGWGEYRIYLYLILLLRKSSSKAAVKSRLTSEGGELNWRVGSLMK